MSQQLRSSFLFLLLTAACGGGGGGAGNGGGGGPIQPPAPPATTPSPQLSGVVAAAAGAGTARIDCRLPGAGFEAALFQGASSGSTYAGAPVVANVTASPVLLGGLTDGVDAFFGLAVRASGTTAWSPVGSVVRTRPGAPLFVDAAASGAGADGLTPATALPSLTDALLVAGSQNGRNVWVRTGDYGNGPFPLGPNVHVAGGFDTTFDLAMRDPAGAGTRLTGSSSQEIVSVLTGGADGSIDGLTIDGGNSVLKGIDVVDGDVELRSLVVRRCADRGIKATVTTATPNRRLQVVGCSVTENGSDGLSSAGPIDLRLDLSRFDGNGEEGADVDDLQAPDNGAVSLHVTGCRFFGNAFEGLDVDLAAAPLAVGVGTFDVRIENSRFEVNGLDGALIDQEHEFSPGFRATIVVRGCVCRGNRLAGLHLDADANGTYRLERLRCTANAGDGLSVTSETNAGEILLQTSWFAGNLGVGARLATGNKILLASHCAFAGNQAGGMRSDAGACAATNCVFVRQAVPLTNTTGAGNVDAGTSSAVFLRAPTAFTVVSAANGGSLTVADGASFGPGTSVAAGDDGNHLLVVQQAGDSVVLDAAPVAFVTPGTLAAYPGSSVTDDLRLAVGSPAIGQGLAPPGAAVTDAGPHGAAAGGEPGIVEPFAPTALNLSAAAPALSTGLTATTPLVLTFDGPIDVASVTPDRVRVLNAGTAIPVGLSVAGNTLTVSPTGAGWSGAPTLQLLPGLQGTDGSPLAGALVAPLRLL